MYRCFPDIHGNLFSPYARRRRLHRCSWPPLRRRTKPVGPGDAGHFIGLLSADIVTFARSLRPPGRFTLQDRRILFLMSVSALVAGYSGSLITHTLPFARESLDLSEGSFSWIFAATRVASFAALAFSAYGDRRGRRRPFLIAFLLLSLANVFTAVVPGVVAFTIFQSIARIGIIAVAGLAIVILAEELSPGLRSYGLGIYALAGSMGTGFSLIILPIAEQGDTGWRILFGISGLGLLAVPLLGRFLRESRAFVRHDTHVPFSKALAAGIGNHFWPLAGIAFFVAAFSSPAFDFALERLIDDLQWETGPARFLLIVFSGAGTVGLLAGGRLADVHGRRPTLVTALVIGLVGGVSYYLFDSGWVLAPAIFVASFGATMLTPAFAAHRAELFPTRIRATAAAWVTNAAILGSIIGFAVGGLTIDRFGLATTIAGLGVGLIVATFLVLTLPETRGRRLAPPADRAGATTPGSTHGRPSTR